MSYQRVPIKRYAEGEQTTNLFSVANSNENRLYVLAVDGNSAATMAETAGHVRELVNAAVYRVDVDELSKHNPKFAASVRRALKSRIQGVVTDKGGFALVGDEVFTPLNEV